MLVSLTGRLMPLATLGFVSRASVWGSTLDLHCSASHVVIDTETEVEREVGTCPRPLDTSRLVAEP